MRHSSPAPLALPRCRSREFGPNCRRGPHLTARRGASLRGAAIYSGRRAARGALSEPFDRHIARGKTEDPFQSQRRHAARRLQVSRLLGVVASPGAPTGTSLSEGVTQSVMNWDFTRTV